MKQSLYTDITTVYIFKFLFFVDFLWREHLGVELVILLHDF
jgi:hypothetical protein